MAKMMPAVRIVRPVFRSSPFASHGLRMAIPSSP